MKIQFFGAAQEVTGSQFLLTVNDKRILVECGLFQGRRAEAYAKNQHFKHDPKLIDAVLVTHPHMDHTGNLPLLVKQGFKGKIYGTPPTIDLSQIMLRDSAHLQEKDLEWVNKIRFKKGEEPLKPLYTTADVEACLDSFVAKTYDETFTLGPGINVRFHEAGHILGSAGIMFDINEKGKPIRLGFTGDIGRPNTPILRDPNYLRDLDILVMETTYGNRLHGHLDDIEEELATTIRNVAKGGGKVIIPSFAVGRTQHVVYLLHKLFDQDRIPDMPIYVDSPLACHATDVYRSYPEYFDRETNRQFLNDHEDPFGFRRLKYITESAESKKLNGLTFPHIIISGSGMCEGGRILHHLRNNIENHRNLILFVGYSANETLGRKLMDGMKTVKIFGEPHEVKCQIKIIDAFSAHADRRELLDYVAATPPERLKHVVLVHGESEQSLPFRDALRSKGYENVYYPGMEEVLTF